MRPIKEMEVGLMFWGGATPQKTLRQVKALGLACGHLGFTGDVDLKGLAEPWKKAFDEEGFAITTVFAAFNGESYADIPTVQKTVGFIPPATRAEREARAKEVIEFGAAAGIPSFACHIGFVPEERESADYAAVRDITRRLCDHAAQYGMSFALETGQETAEAMLHFLADVQRDNLKINFDPANLILYGTGEPIPALEKLGPHVVSVHCKDGVWPDKSKPEALGTEMPLGEGAVGMDRFVATLKKVGYRGALVIEREVSLDQDPDDRHKEGTSHISDVIAGAKLLERLRDSAAAAG
jgi:L-ribulose-5-phosphate 3-epimerase